MDETMTSRVSILSQCAGMNEQRAAELMLLMPELGRVSASMALRLTGLASERSSANDKLCKKNTLRIQRLLVKALRDVLRDGSSELATFLRHLVETHTIDRTKVCLAAILRHYSDALRHRA